MASNAEVTTSHRGTPLGGSSAQEQKHVNLEEQAREKREQEKVDRERDIMRDPHEREAKVSGKPVGRPMPSYRDHDHAGQSVSALRIKDIHPVPAKPTESEMHFMEAGFGPVRVNAPWVTANNPRPGGWYVVDAAGRRFMSHQEFERRYRGGVTV